MARTQETFGAATPGRRVLYSASWVLPDASAEAKAPVARYDRCPLMVNLHRQKE